MSSITRTVTLATVLVNALAATGLTQDVRSFEVSGLPALNFDADEGFGYGAILALYGNNPGGAT